MMVGFCPNCGEPRAVGAQFCAKCGASFVPVVQQAQGETGMNVIAWLASVLSLGGLVWLWLNTGGELVTKLIIVFLLEAIWIGIVFAVLIASSTLASAVTLA